MGEGDVGTVGLAASLVLVVVAVGLSWRQRLGLERSMVWAAARAMVQLLAVGAALALVIDPDSPLVLSWLWVFAMLGLAADTVRRRAPEVPGLRSVALVAFVASTGVALATIFGLGIFPLEGRTLVPLGGMSIGNAMNAAVVVARRLVEELRTRRDEVEARLALGQPSSEAARPYLRGSLRTALTPQIETTKAVGLIFLPGAMTGLILAGVDPVDAVLVQAVVMYLVLGSVAVTSTVIGLGLIRRLFTPDHRLIPLLRPAE